MKSNLKEEAITLRKKGKTYSEILVQVPVAKSTLSLWLRSVDLAKKQKQRITKRKLQAALRGGQVRKENRIKLVQDIYKNSEIEIGKISERELWLLGTVLYWAEGSKEKFHRPGSGVEFTNSDRFMIKLFLHWLLEVCKIKKEEIVFEIYIHKIYSHRLKEVKKFWSEATGFPLLTFKTVYFKKHNLRTVRKNIGNEYNGNLRIRVKASSTLLRRITGWTRGIYNNYCGIV